ncbi:hypothetical protein [Sphingomonas oleivorans]|uniref:hypothetical protein n=1 Tax=Sphingomonas oleivorans TaxID=1735121 RepID=UPI0010573D4B|nr:hypothetical protein [Sphingomonas oleivorans]
MLLRIVAVGTAAGTVAFLFVGDNWRATNIFLVPDLIVCAVLIAGSLLPSPRMFPALLLAFGMGVGVFATATADYLVQGRFGIGAAIGLLTSLVASLILIRYLWRSAR